MKQNPTDFIPTGLSRAFTFPVCSVIFFFPRVLYILCSISRLMRLQAPLFLSPTKDPWAYIECHMYGKTPTPKLWLLWRGWEGNQKSHMARDGDSHRAPRSQLPLWVVVTHSLFLSDSHAWPHLNSVSRKRGKAEWGKWRVEGGREGNGGEGSRRGRKGKDEKREGEEKEKERREGKGWRGGVGSKGEGREDQEKKMEGKGWRETDRQEGQEQEESHVNFKLTASPNPKSSGSRTNTHTKQRPLWRGGRRTYYQLMRYYSRYRKQLGQVALEIKQTLFPSKRY